VNLKNFCGCGQVIALKSATALILERYPQAKKIRISIKNPSKNAIAKTAHLFFPNAKSQRPKNKRAVFCQPTKTSTFITLE
jgi:hypothetical protein